LEETLLKRFYLAIPNLRFSKGVSKGRTPKNFGPTLMDFSNIFGAPMRKSILSRKIASGGKKNWRKKSKK